MIGKPRPCGATKIDGTPCKGKALPGSDFCMAHAATPEEKSERSKVAAARSVEVRRGRAKVRPGAGLARELTRDDVMQAVTEALSAEDRTERLLACLVLVSTFPPEFRQTPGDVRAALEAALPYRVREDPEASSYAQAREIYRAARAEWNLSRRRYSALVGLYVEDYPASLIAPFEDREQVYREELPEPLPPEDAEPLLTRTADGRIFVQFEGELLPQLIPEDAAYAAAEKATQRHRLLRLVR